MATKLFCNLCGKEFERVDEDQGVNISVVLGAGSKYDGCLFDADFCCVCLDKVIDNVAINCKILPISKIDDNVETEVQEDD